METNERTWAQQQWGACQLGDRRLTARAVQMGQAMARDPHASRPAQMGDPLDPTTLTNQAFFRALARLGGHLGRTRDGAPGWRTLWKGWRQLSRWIYGASLAAT